MSDRKTYRFVTIDKSNKREVHEYDNFRTAKNEWSRCMMQLEENKRTGTKKYKFVSRVETVRHKD